MFVLLAGLASLAVSEAQATTVVVGDEGLRASQIAIVPADLDAVIAKIPSGETETVLSLEARTSLMKNRYPGSTFRLRHSGAVRAVALRDVEQPSDCQVSTQTILANSFVTQEGVRASNCVRGPARRWLSYDPEVGSYLARTDIPAGTNLGRLHFRPAPLANFGSPVVVQVRNGPVLVEREAIALQPVHSGRKAFVRTREGQAMSANVDLEIHP